MDEAAVTAKPSSVTGCSALTLGLQGVSVPVTGMLVRQDRVQGWVMDPITLIVTALVAGATSGAAEAASAAVKEAYAGLKALVARRLGGRPDAELVLAKYEQSPEVWQAPLMAELTDAGADRDLELVQAARALMTLVDGAGARAGKYTVDVRGAQGVQVGDRARQHNVFHAPPGG
jgi:hypothetical protein